MPLATIRHTIAKATNASPTVTIRETVIRADEIKLPPMDNKKDTPVIKVNPMLTAVILVGKAVVGEIADKLDAVKKDGV
jgi:hypothetical protein